MNKKTLLSLVLVILWMGMIYVFSNMNSDISNDNSSSIVTNVIEKIDQVTNASDKTIEKHQSNSYLKDANTVFRKICHSIVYLALAILVFNFVIRIMNKKLYIYNIICLLVCLLYAIYDEYHQTFVRGRTGSSIDVLIDMFGTIIGCILISIVYKKIKNSKICHVKEYNLKK